MNKSKSYHGSSTTQSATIPSSLSSEWTTTNTNSSSLLQSSFTHVSQANSVNLKKRSSPSFSSAVEFLSFKWLFKRKNYASNKKQTANNNRDEKQIQDRPGTATRLKPLPTVSRSNETKCFKSLSPLRPSYSFDDVEKFLKMSCMGKLKTKSNENGSNECMSTQDKGKLIRTSTAINLVNYKTQTLCQLCPLCLTTFPKHEMHTVYSCGCKFCKCCFSQYLTVNIKENNDVNFLNCPDSDCPIARNSDSKRRCKNNLISVQEIEMYVDSATFDLYEKFKVDWEVENDPHRTWCPTPNCDNICVITKPTLTSLTSSSSLSSSTTSTANIDKDKGLQFFCPKCDQTFCSHCRRLWHPGFPCQSASEDDNLTLILLRSNNTSLKSEIKRCPRCSVWIERDEGCAQMMCRKCKHVFCWFCLQSLEDDFLLRHYDKGPCKNKLGHSRASVIWHRTQVIGIFAGFGVLLLLASPLFLLAAPCILCCNCCCTSSCKYIEEVDLDAGVGDLSLSSSSSFDDEFLFQSKRQQNDKRA